MSQPMLDYQSRDSAQPRPPYLNRKVELLIAVLLIATTVWILMPRLNRGPGPYHGNRGKCLSNLRVLGQAIELYAAENKGAMPPDWPTLIVAEDLVTEFLVCPSSADEKASSTQPTILRSEFAAGGHCSYTYLGSGRRSQWTKDDVIAFDTVANHGTSINALFGDGHIESVDGALVQQLLSPSIAATQPIRLPSNRPAPELRAPG